MDEAPLPTDPISTNLVMTHGRTRSEGRHAGTELEPTLFSRWRDAVTELRASARGEAT
jgi:hypothetical protein